MLQPITRRQREVLDQIELATQQHGRPPTLRELATTMGVHSTNGIRDHLRILEVKGYLRRDPNISRGLQVVQTHSAPTSAAAAADRQDARQVIAVPLLGRVAAGAPILAEENIEDTLYLDKFFVREGDLFALQVKGDSMINAGIFDGDYVFVRQQPVANRGECVVALIGEEATVKTFQPEANHIRLQPENDHMEPIIVHRNDPSFRLVGKVCAVLRKL